MNNEFQIGDMVVRKNNPFHEESKIIGIITKVYESRIKTTVEVAWFDPIYGSATSTIEPYYLKKVA